VERLWLFTVEIRALPRLNSSVDSLLIVSKAVEIVVDHVVMYIGRADENAIARWLIDERVVVT